ncbi:MAG: phenylalanine 4-monooxygenase [Pseudomonadota bacterium]
MKTQSYQSKSPDAAGSIAYDAEENAVWQDLLVRQEKILPGRVCQAFLDGLDLLQLPSDCVPQLSDVSKHLDAATGFSVEAVPALITPLDFFSLLAQRKFPAATFLRRREHFDYLQEPDIFHEIFGHCPMLTNPVYADFVQRFGAQALAAGSDFIWQFQKLFWFTVEFGLIQTETGTRIYGAGIASSAGEAPYCLESEEAEHSPFDILTVLRTPYRIDIMQPIYFVIEDCHQLYDLLVQDLLPIMREARRLGPLAPKFEPLSQEISA